MHYWNSMHGTWGGWTIMGLYMVIFWIIVIVLAYYLIRKLIQQSNVSAMRETPLEIARKRYAKGEITKEEFDRIKHDLQT